MKKGRKRKTENRIIITTEQDENENCSDDEKSLRQIADEVNADKRRENVSHLIDAIQRKLTSKKLKKKHIVILRNAALGWSDKEILRCEERVNEARDEIEVRDLVCDVYPSD